MSDLKRITLEFESYSKSRDAFLAVLDDLSEATNVKTVIRSHGAERIVLRGGGEFAFKVTGGRDA